MPKLLQHQKMKKDLDCDNDLQQCKRPQKKRKTMRKRVVFADSSSCSHDLVTMYSINDSEEEINNRWIQKHEYTAIRKENFKILMELRKAKGRFKEIDVNECCLRGLENFVSIFVYNIVQNPAKWGPQRVVEFQRIQSKLGICDPDLLRQMAATVSMKDQIKAQKMAFIDALK